MTDAQIRVKRKWYLANYEKHLASNRKYRLANRPKVRDALKRWRLNNPEKAKLASRRYWDKHTEKCRALSREWYHKNKDRAKKNRLRWAKRNRGRLTAHESKRRALQNVVTFGDMTAIAKVYERARELRQWFDVVVDHIIPLSKGGIHASENLQIIYRKENSKKFCHLNYKPTVIFT